MSDIKQKENFVIGDYVVYPAHGVGQICEINKQKLSGDQLDMISIRFESDRMVVHIPVVKVQKSGLRKLSSQNELDTVFRTLTTKARIRRTMWSRRAQEYETKIHSGNPVHLAEVVRDLYRNDNQPDPSYSERQLYRLALDRLAREVAVIEDIEAIKAAEKLESILGKAA